MAVKNAVASSWTLTTRTDGRKYSRVDTTAPGVPSIVATVSPINEETEIDCVITGSTDSQSTVTIYNVYRTIVTGGVPGTYSLITTRLPNALSFTDGNLSFPVEYSYKVSAVNAFGLESALSAEDRATTSTPSSGYAFPAGSAPTTSAAALTAVSTFHNIGLYWSETSGSSSNEGLVRFKKSSDSVWRQGHSMPWDDRPQGNTDPNAQHSTALAVPYGFEQYRTSLVELDSNTSYDVEVLTAGTRMIKTGTFSTWSETFPIGTTVELPTTSSSLLDITTDGTAGGYRLYTFAPGGSATIDGNRTLPDLIRVDASYIIIRGLTLKRAQSSLIRLTRDAHHVVIELNDMTDWGHVDPDNPSYGCNGDYGVATEDELWPVNQNVKQIIIQNNRIHHPFTDANSWGEPARTNSDCGPGNNHPAGAQALFFKDTGGNHVIRYNEFYSDFTHMFDDIMGGAQNFSFYGAFGNDTDIYENKMSHSWDDGLESEGSNMNNRIYKNYTEYALVTMGSFGCVSIGPCFVWRNVATRGIRNPGQTAVEGQVIKSYGKTADPADPDDGLSGGTPAQISTGAGRLFLYHNLAYKSATATVGNGSVKAALNADQLGPTTITARNNIWDTNASISSTHIATINGAESTADWDYDLVGAGHTSWQQIETNCIVANPVFVSGGEVATYGQFAQATSSPALNVASPIPNFNDIFFGSGPDIGAQERSAPALLFGVRP